MHSTAEDSIPVMELDISPLPVSAITTNIKNSISSKEGHPRDPFGEPPGLGMTGEGHDFLSGDEPV